MNNKLEINVAEIANSYAERYENGLEGFAEDLQSGGCSGGVVSELIYYSDTVKFFEDHLYDINNLIVECNNNDGCDVFPTGLSGWNKDDPLVIGTHNQNLLAWFAFEETFRRLYESGSELLIK